jgi:hypothetical protein
MRTRLIQPDPQTGAPEFPVFSIGLMVIPERLVDRQEPEVPDQLVRNYRRPASLGGPAHPDGDVVSIRWFGTATFELAFGDKVILLDNFYDRPARNRSLGFSAAEVTRAD